MVTARLPRARLPRLVCTVGCSPSSLIVFVVRCCSLLQHIQPNTIHFNALLRVCASARDEEGALEVRAGSCFMHIPSAHIQTMLR